MCFKKYTLTVLSLTAATMFCACGDDVTYQVSGSPSIGAADFEVKTYERLPICTEKKEGITVYVSDEKTVYECRDGKWIEEENNLSSSEISDKLSSSSKEKLSSSSSEKRSSSSQEKSDEVELSSSSKTESSSSTKTESSSSVEIEVEGLKPAGFYDCKKYNCVTTEYLNQEMLADGKYMDLLDERDNQVYKAVKIGDQIWMAQNLNYDDRKLVNSFCSDDADTCAMYGRYYSWATAMDSIGEFSNNARGCGYFASCDIDYPARGICPENWHVPTEEEFVELLNYLGETEEERSRNIRSELFDDGMDPYGFSAIAAGGWDFRGEGIGINGVGRYARMWTSTSSRSYFAYFIQIVESKAFIHQYEAYVSVDMDYGLSIRCLKD